MNSRRWETVKVPKSEMVTFSLEISASLMVVLIAMLAGTRELTALVALFGVSAAMILFGLLMERGSRPGRGADWWPSLPLLDSEP